MPCELDIQEDRDQLLFTTPVPPSEPTTVTSVFVEDHITEEIRNRYGMI